MKKENYNPSLSDLINFQVQKVLTYKLIGLDSEYCKATRYNESFLLVIFDLNGLKFVNDNFGHLNGDPYIKNFIDRLKSDIRESDILARYGGDEFIGVFFKGELF